MLVSPFMSGLLTSSFSGKSNDAILLTAALLVLIYSVVIEGFFHPKKSVNCAAVAPVSAAAVAAERRKL